VTLCRREFDLLEYLAEHPDRSSPADNCWARSGATPSPARAPSTSTSGGCARNSVPTGR
jgi:hypothetical protein